MKDAGIVTVVNSAVKGAVKASAVENDSIRINMVSPGWVTETLVIMNMDTAPGLPAKEVAKTYVELITNSTSGEIVVAMKS
ncbi:hypothetical protein [Aurantibacter sp.]|uniref:hypothetical protein n=1 Tax=Aurantibacter sp. TaxID=2807103 RepID=UPI0032664E13